MTSVQKMMHLLFYENNNKFIIKKLSHQYLKIFEKSHWSHNKTSANNFLTCIFVTQLNRVTLDKRIIVYISHVYL